MKQIQLYRWYALFQAQWDRRDQRDYLAKLFSEMTSTILREIKGSSSLFSFFEVYLLKTMERREEEHS